MSAIGVCASGATDVMGESFFFWQREYDEFHVLGEQSGICSLQVGVIEPSDCLLVL